MNVEDSCEFHSFSINYLVFNCIISHYCLTATIVTVLSKFRFQKKKGPRKKFLWAPRLWVGIRWEPILGCISKFDGIKVSGINGLIKKT